MGESVPNGTQLFQATGGLRLWRFRDNVCSLYDCMSPCSIAGVGLTGDGLWLLEWLQWGRGGS